MKRKPPKLIVSDAALKGIPVDELPGLLSEIARVFSEHDWSEGPPGEPIEEIGPDPICPRCGGVLVVFTTASVPSGDGSAPVDLMDCERCDLTFSRKALH